MTPSLVVDLLAAPSLAERVENLTDQGLSDQEGLSWVLDRVDELD